MLRVLILNPKMKLRLVFVLKILGNSEQCSMHREKSFTLLQIKQFWQIVIKINTFFYFLSNQLKLDEKILNVNSCIFLIWYRSRKESFMTNCKK